MSTLMLGVRKYSMGLAFIVTTARRRASAAAARHAPRPTG